MIPSYGVKERSRWRGPLAPHIEGLALQGYTVVPSGLPPAQVGQMARRLDELLVQQVAEAGGAAVIERIGERNLVRAPLACDDLFVELALHPTLLEIVRAVLGGEILLTQQNGILLAPGEASAQSSWHRDLPYQHWTSSRPIALNALFCVDRFTRANGATMVLPGSHRYEPFPAEETVGALAVEVEAEPGSFLLLDAMTFHRGGHNRSAGWRRAVNHVFGLPFLRQQIALPSLLAGRHGPPSPNARVLGYGLTTPDSVGAWRRERLARLS